MASRASWRPQPRDGAGGRDRDTGTPDHPWRRPLRSRERRHVCSVTLDRSARAGSRRRYRPYLETTGGAVGDELPVQVAGVDRRVVVVDAIRAFPTVDPSRPLLLMDYETLALLRFEGSDAVAPAQEWWFAVDPPQREATIDRLRAPGSGAARS